MITLKKSPRTQAAPVRVTVYFGSQYTVRWCRDRQTAAWLANHALASQGATEVWIDGRPYEAAE